MIGFYTLLGTLRNNYTALRTGSFAALLTGDTTASSSDNNTFAFARSDANHSLVIVMNNGTSSNSATIPVGDYFADGTDLTDALDGTSLSPKGGVTVSGGMITVTIPARSGLILSDFAILAANISAAGRVTDKNGRAAARATVEVINQDGQSRSVMTNPFGNYRFDELQAGQIYVFRVWNKKGLMHEQIITLNDSVSNLNFVLEVE